MSSAREPSYICAECFNPLWNWRHNTEHPSVRLQPEAHVFVEPGKPELVVPTEKSIFKYDRENLGPDLILVGLIIIAVLYVTGVLGL